jgi:bifunctional UDP-N-acetylglucosamine pyrophosphorylase/glucosamine-1-phosphate N-acetyltransferase
MIGSNVNLVAPVSVDDGAFIAAGSTITENVPADALSMERSKSEVRKGWAAAYRKKKAEKKGK